MKPILYYIASIIPILISLTACSSTSRVPIEADFLGERISTTADSTIAKYYLEQYLQGKKNNTVFDTKIDKLYTQQKNQLPSRENLKQISQNYSVDFAALYLADQLQKNHANQNLQNTFNQFVANEQLGLEMLINNANRYLILFVPGWDYVANGAVTGADFAQQRRLVSAFGIENHLVSVPPNGSVTDIADYLEKELQTRSQSEKHIIIVGASSAGPSIYLTLTERLTQTEQTHIKAWINLGGILRGSPLIEHYQQFPQNLLFNSVVRIKGWDKEKIKSMSATVSRKRFKRLTQQGGINNKILVINYMGLSLSGQLSIHSKNRYPLLAAEGPNDGLTLLVDIIAPNSLTIVAVGSDHFFAEDPRINKKTIALMKIVISMIEKNN